MAGVLALHPRPDEVRLAREFCTRELAALGHDPDHDVVDSAAIIASELVTNAVRAGASRINVHTQVVGRRFRIAVSDDTDGEVVPGNGDLLAVNGRGLRIVASLASDWGVAPAPEGKQVWAELVLPADVSDREELADAAAG